MVPLVISTVIVIPWHCPRQLDIPISLPSQIIPAPRRTGVAWLGLRRSWGHCTRCGHPQVMPPSHLF
jgi:hypothetical protein